MFFVGSNLFSEGSVRGHTIVSGFRVPLRNVFNEQALPRFLSLNKAISREGLDGGARQDHLVIAVPLI